MIKKIVKTILGEKVYSKMSKAYRSTFNKNDSVNNDLLYPHKLEMIGGKLVCLDLIPEGSTIISGGIGNDIHFELELIQKKNFSCRT